MCPATHCSGGVHAVLVADDLHSGRISSDERARSGARQHKRTITATGCPASYLPELGTDLVAAAQKEKQRVSRAVGTKQLAIKPDHQRPHES